MTRVIRFLAATVAALLFTLTAHAGTVDVNKATQAELESVKGIGPSMSSKILNERKKGNFKDWNDMVDRIQGVGPGNAAKFSAQGLTVNGTSYAGGSKATGGKHKSAGANPTAQGVVTTVTPSQTPVNPQNKTSVKVEPGTPTPSTRK